MKAAFEIYRGDDGQFRWRKVRPDGTVIEECESGFGRLFDCQKAVGRVNDGATPLAVRIVNTQTGAV